MPRLKSALVRRIAVSLISFVLVAASCSGAVEPTTTEVVQTTLATSTTILDPPAAEPGFDWTAVTVDPIVAALHSAADADPSLGSLVRDGEAEVIETCARRALESALGEEAITAIVDRTFDPSRLTASARSDAALALAGCADVELIERAVAVTDATIASCITTRVVDLDRVADLYDGLLAGGTIAGSSIVTGFRFTCQDTFLDETFVAHPPGTIGEDLRLVSEIVIDAWFPIMDSPAFERACLVRATMAALPIEWLLEWQAISAGERPHPSDHFMSTASGADVETAINLVRDAITICVPPFRLYRAFVSLDTIASPEAIGCLRDSLTDEDEATLGLRAAAEIDTTDAPDLLPKPIRTAFVDCGFDGPPLG